MRRRRTIDDSRQLFLPLDKVVPTKAIPLSADEFLQKLLRSLDLNSVDRFRDLLEKRSISSTNNSIRSPDWLETGLLKYYGYAVGNVHGRTRAQRKATLTSIFEAKISPESFPSGYVATWGDERSLTRLKKMAASIAAFCRTAKKKLNSDMSCAIDDWEGDLAWLKVQYYDGKFDDGFKWPET